MNQQTETKTIKGSTIGEVSLGERSIMRAIRLIEMESEIHLSVEFLIPVSETAHKAMGATMRVTKDQLQDIYLLMQKGISHVRTES